MAIISKNRHCAIKKNITIKIFIHFFLVPSKTTSKVNENWRHPKITIKIKLHPPRSHMILSATMDPKPKNIESTNNKDFLDKNMMVYFKNSAKLFSN